jgi:hypothetical protein
MGGATQLGTACGSGRLKPSDKSQLNVVGEKMEEPFAR